MSRRLVLTLILFLAVGAHSLAQVQPAVTLKNKVACAGQGFDGHIELGKKKLAFISCSSGGIHTVQLSNGAGQNVTSLSYNSATGSVSYTIAGVDMNSPLTTADEASVNSVLNAPEASLAPFLWTELSQLGMDPNAEPMGTLAATLVEFEKKSNTLLLPAGTLNCATCMDPETNCMGCCGVGCSSCFVCAQACQDHDECVDNNGHQNCLQDLGPAVLQALSCFFSGGMGEGCCNEG